jgi:Fe-S-cluster-containing hydrogenase component 2
VYRVQVDCDTCIGCEACAKACPSTVMTGILKREGITIPDCFACSNCLQACPTGAVSFGVGRRCRPPGDWSAFALEARRRSRPKRHAKQARGCARVPDQLALGASHTCLLDPQCTPRGRDGNQAGQLGSGTTFDASTSATPEPVPGESDEDVWLGVYSS